MKLYVDCTNGVSSDMILAALLDLGVDEEECKRGIAGLGLGHGCKHEHEHRHKERHWKNAVHEKNHPHTHSRSYKEIKELIRSSALSDNVKAVALRTYEAIAVAEAEVHGETLETVHFHEVGRDRAIENVIGVAIALDFLNPSAVYCSSIHDGHGTILCSHGEIPVPVPAVAAMMKRCDFTFVTDDVETEMVTPTGLALLIGMGAVPVDSGEVRGLSEPGKSSGLSEPGEIGEVQRIGVGRGTRDIGRDGLKIHMIEKRL